MFKNRFLFSGHSSAQIAEETRDKKVVFDCDPAESRTVDPRCQLLKEDLLDMADTENRHLSPVQDSDLDEKSGVDCSQEAEIIDPRCPVLDDPSKSQGPKIKPDCTDDDLLKLNPSCLTNPPSIPNQAQDSHGDEEVDSGAIFDTETREKTLPVKISAEDLVEDEALPVDDLQQDTFHDPDCDQGSIRSLNPECFSSSNFHLIIEDPFQSLEPEDGNLDLIVDDSFRSLQEPEVENLCSGNDLRLPNSNCVTDPQFIATQGPDSEALLELESLLSMSDLSQNDARIADVLVKKSADKPEVLTDFEPEIHIVKLAAQDMRQIGTEMDALSTLDKKSAENLNSTVDSNNIQVSAGSLAENSAISVTEIISNVGISAIQVEPSKSAQESNLMTSQESSNLETNNIEDEPSFEETSKNNTSLEDKKQQCPQHVAFGVEIEGGCINQTKKLSDLEENFEWLLERTTDKVDILTEIEDLDIENPAETKSLVLEAETNENDVAHSQEDSPQDSPHRQALKFL